jgi:DNA-binding CsgD family transcriptional regulator
MDDDIFDKPDLEDLAFLLDDDVFDKPSLEDLMHYGMPRRSGRYPWGSGKDPYQHGGQLSAQAFSNRVKELKSQGVTEKEIAEYFGITTTGLRAEYSRAHSEIRQDKVDTAKGLKEKGLSNYEIGRKMGVNESTVRSLLNSESEARMTKASKTADFLKSKVDEKGMIDVGAGTELALNVSKEKMKEALYILKQEGYEVYNGRMPQATNPGKFTTLSVLCPPGTEHKEIYNYENVHSLEDYISYDGGDTFKKSFQYPSSMDSKRLAIRYAEDGGNDKDGFIELRRSVPDLDLGNSLYAQVRIMVDGKKYIKGMAGYSDNLPDGVDVIFNTNKTKNKSKLECLKDIKNDPDNPFGSLIKEHGGQSYYVDKDGKEKLSLINKRAEEGDWSKWSTTISSQVLSKQPPNTIETQLNLSASNRKLEFEKICELTNPVLKRSLLKSFADGCDAAAVHLKAAAFPGQKNHVILPLTSLKDNEVYAPSYKNGEKIALIRHPHGGTFEIPILTVNNKNKEGKNVMGSTPLDAIGINSKVAERLSGADFDGDTVITIPLSNKVKINSTRPLDGLQGFDPKTEYPEREGMKHMKNTQKEMGTISNLINDMTLKGADTKELARAVRHSMVVIDAEKHSLDYKKSEQDNGISALKSRYQNNIDPITGKQNHGASTLISRAKSTEYVLKRVGTPKINQKGKPWYDSSKPEGAYIYKEVREEYTDKNGKTKIRMQKSTRMAEAADAFSLSSGTPTEEKYARYANTLKELANTARKELVYTDVGRTNRAAKAKYAEEVASLNNKLKLAQANAPRERAAQALANSEIKAKKAANPDLTKSEEDKIRQQAMARARVVVGAKRTLVDITDNEWEAIQAGAVSPTRLAEIFLHTDSGKLKERATPKDKKEVSNAMIANMKAMSNSGYTTADIAEKLGVSTSTVIKYIK